MSARFPSASFLMTGRKAKLASAARSAVVTSALVASALLTGCDQPPVVPTSDVRQNVTLGRISGSVVVQGTTRGNAVLSLFDAQHPPPPIGTGHALAFSFVPESDLFGDAPAGSGGPFTASFNFDLVAPGDYLILGFIDKDGCLPPVTGCRPPDFIPWYSVTREPNQGDVAGGAVDGVTHQPMVVHVGVDDAGVPVPAVGVPVSFSAQLSTLPIDRPAFQLSGGTLQYDPTTGVQTVDLLPAAIPAGIVDEHAQAFLVKYIDDNNDGQPEDINGDGLPDFWPKVYVRKVSDLDPTSLTDENDRDKNGLVDDAGVDYPHLGQDAGDGQPDVVILAAGFVPTNVYSLLNDSGGQPIRDSSGQLIAAPVSSLKLAIKPLALDVTNPAAPVPLAGIPKGIYSVTLVSFTGQTWRLPNELEPPVANAAGLTPVETQAGFIQVK